MAIRSRLLNKRMDIVNKTSIASVTDSGDTTYPEISIATDVPCRLTRNKKDEDRVSGEEGILMDSEHKIFLNQIDGVTIKRGYTANLNNGKSYTIDFVDDEPGGTENHIELYVSEVE